MPSYQPVCPFTVSPSPAGVWKAPDLTRARRLVAAAGGRRTPVTVWTFEGFEPEAHAIVQALRALGFHSRARRLDGANSPAEQPPDHPRRWPQAGIIAWIPDTPEPSGTMRSLLSCASFTPHAPETSLNRSGYCSRRFDAAVDRAAATGRTARQALKQIELRIARAAPIVPLYTRRSFFATAPRVGNLQYNPFVYTMLDRVWVR